MGRNAHTGSRETRMSPDKETQEPSNGFSAEEKVAMKERARELKAEARMNEKREEGETALLAKIAEMDGPDSAMAEKLHKIVAATAPELMPRTWYGMPAYAKAGKVICFFQSGSKFDSRYATLGFTDAANLDQGAMWPTSFALAALSEAEEKAIVALLKRAVH